MDEQELEMIIENLFQKFQENPLGFNVEHNIQSKLANMIRDNLSTKKAEITEIEVDPRISDKDYFEHHMRKKAIENGVDRVIEEPTVLINEEESRDRIDIGVLKKEAAIRIQNGSKKYKQKDFEALIEVKYPPNDHYYKILDDEKNRGEKDKYKGKTTTDLEKNSNFSKIVSQEGWNDDYGVGSDIEKISYYSRIDSKFVLLFSHYDLLYQEVQTELRSEGKEKLYSELGRFIYDYFNELGKENNVKFKYCGLRTGKE